MEDYEITLHSPMGERHGAMSLEEEQAVVTLLGFTNHLSLCACGGSCYRLHGQMGYCLGDFPFEAEITIRNNAFDCMAHTGKGDMRFTGRRICKEEQL